MSASTRAGFSLLVVAHPDRPAAPGLARLPVCDPHRIRHAADVYEALASLVTGPRPAVLALNVDDMDWDEFDFFDHLRRLAPEIRVLVTSATGDQSRLEHACHRGAELLAGFDLDAWTSGAADVQPILQPPVERPQAHSAPAASVRADPTASPVSSDEEALEQDTIPFTVLLGSKPSLKTARELVAGSVQPVLTPVEPPPSPPSVPATATGAPAPNVRLVQAEERDDAPAIPFPWAPSPTRPRRTPPGGSTARAEEIARPGHARGEPGDFSRSSPEPAGRAPINVELTREEITALLRGPHPGHESLREGQA